MPAPRQRYALVSTYLGMYNEVPHQGTLDELARRCEVHTTLGLDDAKFEEVKITA